LVLEVLDGYKTGRKVHSLVKDEIIYSSKLSFFKIKDICNDEAFKFYRSRFISFDAKYKYNSEKINIIQGSKLNPF